MSRDVLTFGEGMLRLSVPPGTRLENMSNLDVHPAGAEANVAANLASLGLNVAWYSILPDTPLGRRMSGELAHHGVDLSLVEWEEEGRMGVFFVELSVPPRPNTVIYDRSDSTASRMSSDRFPWETLESCRLVHVSGITPALSASCRELTLEVVDRVAELDARLSLDVNFRAKLWHPDQAKETFQAMSGKVDLLIVNHEDAREVFGFTGGDEEVLTALRDQMKATDIVLSKGEAGASWLSGTMARSIPARQATIIDRIGAGDAFAAGLIDGFLNGDLSRGVEIGTVMAAMALGVHGDFLTTSRREVVGLLDQPRRRVDR